MKKWISKNIDNFLVLYENKLRVCHSGITFFVQIRLTHQWSSFSRMMLWWSDCSASITVFIQLISNVNKLYMMKKKLVEAASATFHIIIYEISYKKRTNCNKSNTSQKAKKWMRLKMFQLMHKNKHHADQFSIIGHMLIVWAWMLVNELH